MVRSTKKRNGPGLRPDQAAKMESLSPPQGQRASRDGGGPALSGLRRQPAGRNAARSRRHPCRGVQADRRARAGTDGRTVGPSMLHRSAAEGDVPAPDGFPFPHRGRTVRAPGDDVRPLAFRRTRALARLACGVPGRWSSCVTGACRTTGVVTLAGSGLAARSARKAPVPKIARVTAERPDLGCVSVSL